jgi:hypothetical protein
MTTTVFTLLASAFAGTKQKVTFQIEGALDGTIRTIITTKLDPVPENATKETRQLYAALSTPLIVSGLPGEVEEALIDRIGHHMHQLSVGLSALDQIQSISESAVRSASKGKAVSTAAAPPSALPAASPLVDDEQELDDGETHPQSNQPAGGIGGF